jgi:hypothetical protein
MREPTSLLESIQVVARVTAAGIQGRKGGEEMKLAAIEQTVPLISVVKTS